jgi:hypothetical protein
MLNRSLFALHPSQVPGYADIAHLYILSSNYINNPRRAPAVYYSIRMPQSANATPHGMKYPEFIELHSLSLIASFYFQRLLYFPCSSYSLHLELQLHIIGYQCHRVRMLLHIVQSTVQ